MRPWKCTIAMIAVLALLLAACGDGGEDAAEPAEGESAESPENEDGDAAEDEAAAEDGEADAAGEQEYETEELIIGLVAPNQIYYATYIAAEKGWFEEEGLEPTFVSTESSSGAVQQAASESVHLAGATPDAAVMGISRGADVEIVATTVKASALAVVGGQDVTDWEDVRGETVGVSALSGGEIALLRRILEENGLSEGDYDVVVSGPTPAKVAALQEGSVAAAVLFSPADFALEAEGFNILGNTAELPEVAQIPTAVYVVASDWAQENDRGVRAARALLRAKQWLLEPENREEAVEIFAEASGQEPEYVAATFEMWIEDMEIASEDGMVTEQDIQNTIDMMVEDGDLEEPLPEPADLLNLSYIEQAAADLGASD